MTKDVDSHFILLFPILSFVNLLNTILTASSQTVENGVKNKIKLLLSFSSSSSSGHHLFKQQESHCYKNLLLNMAYNFSSYFDSLLICINCLFLLFILIFIFFFLPDLLANRRNNNNTNNLIWSIDHILNTKIIIILHKCAHI